MQSVRLLRIFVPIVLLGLVAAVVVVVQSRPSRHSVPDDPSPDQAARMEGFRFSDLVAGRRRLLVEARVGRVDEAGAFDVDDVSRLEVDREGQGPLVLTAKHGAGSGLQGKRVIRLAGGVTLHDETGLGVGIPSVEIDQVGGFVRSVGQVRLSHGAWNGTAEAAVYDLNGKPNQFQSLKLDGPEGGHLVADHGSMPAGSRVLNLTGNVEASQGGMTLRADAIELVRGGDGRLESARAFPSVTGEASAGGGPAGLVAGEARATWDRNGKLASVLLTGGARIRHVRGSLAAETIELQASEPAGSFAVSASRQVVVSGPTPKGTGELSSDALHVTLDPHGELRDGLATGNVRFDGEGNAGEAAEARLTSLAADGTVTLRATDDRRARLASGRTRIVANSIVTDTRGVKLRAEGRVESTLLPVAGRSRAEGSPMFGSSEAVHFVSATLDSTGSGTHLVFRGDVRGWQGERTLSADSVEMIQEGETLNARGRVSTRLPRDATRATIEADYVEIAAEDLAYRGAAHIATYEGSVRVRQAEGWLHAPRLVATLAEGGPGMREVEALDGVRFEYRAQGKAGLPTTATGEGDRAVYDAADRVLRVYGDKAPASVRSTGPSGGTTVGRVLRYALDSGALDVESREGDRVTIRTPKK